MGFNFFKKKQPKDIDLTGTVSGGIPLPKRLQKKINVPKADNGIITLSDTSSPTSAETSQTPPASSGGFFNFFGNDSSPSSYAPAPAPTTDSSYLDSSQTAQTTNKLSEISDRLSRLIDRVELLERKMDRLERKSY